MRILLVKTSSLGDVVHNLPVVSDIKRQYPTALIDWVVEDSFSEIATMHPAVNCVIPVATRRWRKSPCSNQTWRELVTFKQQLQSQIYDVVIDTQGLLKSGLITALTLGKRKCGYDKKSAKEPLACCFYQQRYTVSRQLHAVQRNRQLTALALNYNVSEFPLDYGITVNNEPPIALPKTYILGLHGTSRDSKLWPEEHWLSLGKQLQSHGIVLVFPWGNRAELHRAQRIAINLEQSLVLPKLNLRSLSCVIQKAQAVIGVDTGLAHLSIALHKPTIAIYTDTSPELTGLYSHTQQLYANLGGRHLCPSVHDVLTQLKTLEIISS